MSRLNAKVSNGPWLGENGKRHGLEAHDVLFLNRELLRSAGETWSDAAIRSRGDELAKAIVEIWPTPEGHRSGFGQEKVSVKRKLDLSDLLSAGALQPGMLLHPRHKKFAQSIATLLPDGRLDVQGTIYSSPSEAARTIAGRVAMNGWWYFFVDPKARRTLRDVRSDYLESIALDADEDDTETGDEDD
jgi:hypothetical protein